MKVIKIFSDYGDSTGAMQYRNQMNKFDPLYSKNQNLYRITDGEDYTHAIIFNTAMPVLNIPKDHVIGMAHEPPPFLNLSPTFISYAEKHIGKYFIGDTTGLKDPFIQKFGYMSHMKIEYNNLTNWDLRKPMSLMVSDKTWAPGHKYRYKLAHAILTSKLPVDIYGRGCPTLEKMFPNDQRLKGKFKGHSMYTDYKYHLSIENFKLPAYFSEKIINTLCCGSVPVYLGSPLMNDYAISLTGDIDNDIALITNLLSNQNQIPKFKYRDYKHKYSFSQMIADEFN